MWYIKEYKDFRVITLHNILTWYIIVLKTLLSFLI